MQTQPPRPPLLIIEAGRPVRPLRRHGRFGHWVRVAAGLGRDDAVAVDVESGERLPSHAGFAGAIVTGSAAMVTDRAGWSETTAAWLHDAAHAGLPLLGICYGHQLLAHALGGEAGDSPGGRTMGTIRVQPLAAAASDPLFAGLPESFDAQTSHSQCVLRVPDGATVLARAAHDPHHVFRWGEQAWGVQFHPEFSATHMRGYVRARWTALQREGLDPAAIMARIGAAPDARRVLRRFAMRALGLSQSGAPHTPPATDLDHPADRSRR